MLALSSRFISGNVPDNLRGVPRKKTQRVNTLFFKGGGLIKGVKNLFFLADEWKEGQTKNDAYEHYQIGSLSKNDHQYSGTVEMFIQSCHGDVRNGPANFRMTYFIIPPQHTHTHTQNKD